MRQDGERIFLTLEEALPLLPQGDTIHSFSNRAGGLMLGCDMSRQSVIDKITERGEIEVAGEMAQRMKHGLRFMPERLFIESKSYDEYIASQPSQPS